MSDPLKQHMYEAWVRAVAIYSEKTRSVYGDHDFYSGFESGYTTAILENPEVQAMREALVRAEKLLAEMFKKHSLITGQRLIRERFDEPVVAFDAVQAKLREGK